jgi:hypothetical protein
MAATTGGRWAALRRGEVLNLRWRNIDWANNRLQVISQADWDVKDKDARVVPICPELNELLLAAFDEAEEGEDRVIPAGTVSVKNITQFRLPVQRAGVDRTQPLRASQAYHGLGQLARLVRSSGRPFGPGHDRSLLPAGSGRVSGPPSPNESFSNSGNSPNQKFGPQERGGNSQSSASQGLQNQIAITS